MASHHAYVVLALALGACSAAPGPEETSVNPIASNDAQASCDADPARRFIGETATAGVIEQARKASGARGARTLKPGQVVTMEHDPSRLNIDVDAANLITNVRCG